MFGIVLTSIDNFTLSKQGVQVTEQEGDDVDQVTYPNIMASKAPEAPS